ncbi:MAG TPA: hypothetical protein VKV40_24645 [Ktedonobacteraceae bacterium]|nr:hypothetical protein [Ktedonobacteraceae bacterium]
MAENDPRQVIIDYICRPRGPIIEERSMPVPPGKQGNAWRAITRAPGGMGARVSTIQFLQQRSISDRQLHLVEFEDEEGRLDSWLCSVLLEPDGHWRYSGGANVSRAETMPKREHPWANLAGGWNVNLFWAGGRVLDNGLNVVRVRLVAEDGTVLEDTVQDGIVMFISNETLSIPVRVELYDDSATLVGTGIFPRHLPKPPLEG